MDDAATTLGAGVVRRTLRITLPLTLPAVMAAFIVAFLEAIALFGAPALIALPGRFQVMTTTLWQFFEFPPRVEVAAAYAMPLLLITVLLFWLQQRIIARKGYVALTGKGGERRLVRLGGSAALALALALAIAYIVRRGLVPFGRALAYVAMAPFVIPGIVLAIGFYAAYTSPPLVLYGTAWILILAFTTRFLPIAYANSDAALRSINPELEDAVRVLGGGRLLALRRVVAPLLKRGLAGAFILVFIPATRELSAAIFLYTTGTQV